jgi:enolase
MIPMIKSFPSILYLKGKSLKIKDIRAKTIPHSRGGKTVQSLITLDDNTVVSGSAPVGISKSRYEVSNANPESSYQLIESMIKPLFIGQEPNLHTCDQLLREEMPSNGAIFSFSVAMARAEAYIKKVELYQVLMPSTKPEAGPCFFCFDALQGGAHASNEVMFQEFLLIPKQKNRSLALATGKRLQEKIIALLERDGYATNAINVPCWHLGKDGKGLVSDDVAFELIMRAIEDVGEKVSIGIDVAASEYYDQKKRLYCYRDQSYSSQELLERYLSLIDRYPISLFEDPFDSDDLDAWKLFMNKAGDRIQIMGEDLFAGSAARIAWGAKEGLVNAAVIKSGQTATVSELIASIEVCHQNGIAITASPRSCETEDIFIADLTHAAGAKQFKTIACICPFHAKKNKRLEMLGF